MCYYRKIHADQLSLTALFMKIWIKFFIVTRCKSSRYVMYTTYTHVHTFKVVVSPANRYVLIFIFNWKAHSKCMFLVEFSTGELDNYRFINYNYVASASYRVNVSSSSLLSRHFYLDLYRHLLRAHASQLHPVCGK